METNKSITVWGAGVTGLTTAVQLLEQGYSVTIVAKESAQKTVSGVAAAIWFPYKASPAEKVNAWGRASYNKYKELTEIEGSGISFIPFTVVELEGVNPHWISALPEDLEIEKEKKELLGKTGIAYTALFPLVETHIFLKYLQKRFHDLGGRLVEKNITGTEDLPENGLTVNCLGLGAQKVFGDTDMFPIQGQILKFAPSDKIKGTSIEFPFDDHKNEHLYVIPRSDCIVVGGSARVNQQSLVPDDELTERIRKRAFAAVPELKQQKELGAVVGLRPGRKQVRLEKDPKLPVVHNYGHGGSGYTIAWGCAQEVNSIINTLL